MRKLAVLALLAAAGCTPETQYQVAWHATNVFCLARTLPAMAQILTTTSSQAAGHIVCDSLTQAAPAGGPPDQLPAMTQ